VAQAGVLAGADGFPGVAALGVADLRVRAGQRLVLGSYRARQLWCKGDTPSSPGGVDLAYEFAVGGAGGGQVLVTFVELRAEV
jgi:hypothetical protein